MALRTINMCLASLDLLENLFSQWLHWALEKGRALVWQVTKCLLRLSPLPKAFSQVPQVKDGRKCTELCQTNSFLLEKFF